MKFIIPQNYNFKNKIFCIFSYSTAIFDIIYFFILFFILNLLFKNWNVKIFLLISLFFPILIFSIVGLNGESFVYIIQYILQYVLKPKVYLFKKY